MEPRAAQAPGTLGALRPRLMGLPFPRDSTSCFFKPASAEELSRGLEFTVVPGTAQPWRCQPYLYTNLMVKDHSLGPRATSVLFPLCKMPGCLCLEEVDSVVSCGKKQPELLFTP